MQDTKADWQIVDDGRALDETMRLPVPGGWIYSRKVYGDDVNGVAVAMCFVPGEAAR